jgi:soluble lytic murein transglycosylase
MSIMRVESHFDRHAMSYANAIGLMQILPRTGRRVAALSGRDEFQVADLLRASDGIDLSAWYVRALSDRFHGQAPLVVAAYNGGPHNVASWILRRADRDRPLPMDELLEEIPFTETHRYVRRVLGSYAVYTALAGLPPPALPEDVDRDVASGVGF